VDIRLSGKVDPDDAYFFLALLSIIKLLKGLLLSIRRLDGLSTRSFKREVHGNRKDSQRGHEDTVVMTEYLVVFWSCFRLMIIFFFYRSCRRVWNGAMTRTRIAHGAGGRSLWFDFTFWPASDSNWNTLPSPLLSLDSWFCSGPHGLCKRASFWATHMDTEDLTMTEGIM
jgi:hypothetical protein